MLNHRQWNNDRHKEHFESGVRLGAGSFNLVIKFQFVSCFGIMKKCHFTLQLISMLPQRILKLLEFIGFSGSRVSYYFTSLMLNLKLSYKSICSFTLWFLFMLFIIEGWLQRTAEGVRFENQCAKNPFCNHTSWLPSDRFVHIW